ncbi:uncharacterized protein LOC113322530 isoform X2 [Papaver somniferum]|uniref:uncharacterized protein LOC113322530 isoform X2 n=1 Tax=Papaver somniferum TaxID=3469 RepID=UPI000E702C19|nr:uncharacterized protein LOC113322530 isoform X2 [Papaver somniferum]
MYANSCMENSLQIQSSSGRCHSRSFQWSRGRLSHSCAEKPLVVIPDAIDNAEPSSVDDEAAGLTVDLLNKILQKQIVTTVSIPPHCRLLFSRTLKSDFDAILSNPMNLASCIRLLLLPACTLHLYVPKNSREERSGCRRKLQAAAIDTALRPPGKKKKNKNLMACTRKMSHGHYNADVRILSSDGIAPPTRDTLFELQQKYPFDRPPVIPSEDISAPALSVVVKDVLAAIKSFPKGTSCGRDGLRARHLLDAMSGTGAVVADDLLVTITALLNSGLQVNALLLLVSL